MPYKNPLTPEQLEKRRARSLRWYHAHKADFSDEQKERRRENTKKAMKKYRDEHREELNEKSKKAMRAARAADPEKYRESALRSYYLTHEKRKAEKRAIHHANRDAANEARRAHYHAHKDEWKEKRVQQRQEARINSPWIALLSAARYRAKIKGVPYSLTTEWAASRWTGRCEITGLPFRIGGRESGPKFFSPSIDRIVPAQGYVPENCRFVLWAVNAMKYDGTDEDILMVAKAIVSALGKDE